MEKQLASVEADFKAEVAKRRTMLRVVVPPQDPTARPHAKTTLTRSSAMEMEAVKKKLAK